MREVSVCLTCAKLGPNKPAVWIRLPLAFKVLRTSDLNMEFKSIITSVRPEPELDRARVCTLISSTSSCKTPKPPTQSRRCPSSVVGRPRGVLRPAIKPSLCRWQASSMKSTYHRCRRCGRRAELRTLELVNARCELLVRMLHANHAVGGLATRPTCTHHRRTQGAVRSPPSLHPQTSQRSDPNLPDCQNEPRKRQSTSSFGRFHACGSAWVHSLS